MFINAIKDDSNLRTEVIPKNQATTDLIIANRPLLVKYLGLKGYLSIKTQLSQESYETVSQYIKLIQREIEQ